MTRLDLSLSEQWRLSRHLTSSASPDQYCRRFFDFLWQKSQPARYLMEKTPNNVRYIDDIVRMFPRAKLVAIYRDGRDVAVSDQSFQQYYKRRPTWFFQHSALRWREDMVAQFRACERADLYTLSYEDLTRNGSDALRPLLEYLGLSVRSDLLDDMIERSAFSFRSGRPHGEEDRYSFYRKGIIGDWRNRLEPHEAKLFKEVAGDLLIKLGYEPSDDWCL
jgi:Sulfotransferase family